MTTRRTTWTTSTTADHQHGAPGQQHTNSGQRRLYWYTDLSTPQQGGVPLLQPDLDRHLLQHREPVLFPQ